MMMTNILSMSFREEAQRIYPLPSPLLTSVEVFKTAHLFFRDMKHLVFARENATFGNPLMTGTFIHLFAPFTCITQQALQICLITHCVNQILNQYGKVYDSYEMLVDTYHHRYPIYEIDKMVPIKKGTGFILKQKLTIKQKCHFQLKRCVKLIIHLFALIKELIQLAFCLQDAHLLCNQDFDQKRYACTELVAHLRDYKKRLEDPTFLEQEVKTQSVMIDKILKNLNIDMKAINLIKNIKTNVDQLQGNELVSDFKQTFLQMVGELFGNGTNSLSISFTPKRPVHTHLKRFRYSPWGGQEMVCKKNHTLSGTKASTLFPFCK